MIRICPSCYTLFTTRTFHIAPPLFSQQIRIKRNPYHVLGLKAGCTQSDIKARFYELSKQLHPDVNKSPTATARFTEITQAYEAIGTLAARKTYDQGYGMRSGRHRGTTTYRYTGYRGGFNADDFSAEDWKKFQQYDRLYRERRRRAESSSRPFDHGDFESRYRASNFNRAWTEKAGSGGTTAESRRRHEWLRFQEEEQRRKDDMPKPSMSVYLVAVFALGTYIVAHLYREGMLGNYNLRASSPSKVSSWPDEPGATAGSMSLSEKFWNSDGEKSKPKS